jgi:Zn-dependent protease
MPMDSNTVSDFCPQCGTDIPKRFLVCPGCQKLVHSENLKQLAQQATQAEQENRLSDALSFWRQALDLLPPGSTQYQALTERITVLGRQVDGLVPSRSNSSVVQEQKSLFGKTGGKVGIFGFLAVLFSKLKLLILGLAKLQTILSMLLFFGIYWNIWGWKFALGFVLSIYIHEMGHVVALNRYGIKATAPVFIPFVGAIIRVKQILTNSREDARVGLAGPIWGLGAAVTAFLLFQVTNDEIFKAIAQIGAWINLFNLMPVWQLDGGRGFHSLNRWQRWTAVLAIGGMWCYTQEGLLLILLAFAILKALRKDAPLDPDYIGLTEYVFLVVILSIMCTIPVPTGTP